MMRELVDATGFRRGARRSFDIGHRQISRRMSRPRKMESAQAYVAATIVSGKIEMTQGVKTPLVNTDERDASVLK
jgi:hypothetical protein